MQSNSHACCNDCLQFAGECSPLGRGALYLLAAALAASPIVLLAALASAVR